MDTKSALEVLAALSHESRLDVFRMLVRAGPGGLAAGDIADRLHARQNTMSSHLKQLHAASLIDSRRDGRRVIYMANYGTARELILFLMQDCCASSAAVREPLAKALAANC